MDPNANLAEQERIIRAWDYRSVSAGSPPADERARLAELRAALVAWLERGGFPPTWTAAPFAVVYYIHLGLVKGAR
jgi:hypothetical protein